MIPTNQGNAGLWPFFGIVFFALAVTVASPTVFAQTMTSSITHHGITWQFDRNHQVGQFISGDYWVIGPVTVNSISRPASNAGRDGSMINPMPGMSHGYDSRIAGYDSALNVANQLPNLIVQSGSSLVSTISRNPTETVRANRRPALEVGAVLTVLDSPPSSTAFRPPYSGTRKIVHDFNKVNSAVLPNLPRVSTATQAFVDTATNYHARPWLDHRIEWEGDDLHPRQNMPNYGRDMAAQIHDSALLLMLDLPADAKRTILIRFVQLGIDFHENVMNGAHWGGVGGGIGVGRKLPGLLSGYLLKNEEMREFSQKGSSRYHFQEDSQVEYLTQGLLDRNRSGSTNIGYWDGLPLGTPVWIERGYVWPNTGWVQVPGSISYQFCCTTNATHGAALVVRLMGLESLWNYPPWLEWVDNYMSPGFYLAPDGFSVGWHRSWSPFAEEMWDTYRERGGFSRPAAPLAPELTIE